MSSSIRPVENSSQQSPAAMPESLDDPAYGSSPPTSIWKAGIDRRGHTGGRPRMPGVSVGPDEERTSILETTEWTWRGCRRSSRFGCTASGTSIRIPPPNPPFEEATSSPDPSDRGQKSRSPTSLPPKTNAANSSSRSLARPRRQTTTLDDEQSRRGPIPSRRSRSTRHRPPRGTPSPRKRRDGPRPRRPERRTEVSSRPPAVRIGAPARCRGDGRRGRLALGPGHPGESPGPARARAAGPSTRAGRAGSPCRRCLASPVSGCSPSGSPGLRSRSPSCSPALGACMPLRGLGGRCLLGGDRDPAADEARRVRPAQAAPGLGRPAGRPMADDHRRSISPTGRSFSAEHRRTRIVPSADVASMLTRSLEISPLNPTARLALAQARAARRPDASVGPQPGTQSRRGEPGLECPPAPGRRGRRTRRCDSTSRPSRSPRPAGSRGPPRRASTMTRCPAAILLPGEDAVRDIVTEMALAGLDLPRVVAGPPAESDGPAGDRPSPPRAAPQRGRAAARRSS